MEGYCQRINSGNPSKFHSLSTLKRQIITFTSMRNHSSSTVKKYLKKREKNYKFDHHTSLIPNVPKGGTLKRSIIPKQQRH